MANTKKLSKEERKSAKRAARRELSKLVESMTIKLRSEYRKSEKGLRAFIAEKQAAKQEAAE